MKGRVRERAHAPYAISTWVSFSRWIAASGALAKRADDVPDWVNGIAE